jgi:glutaredoxin
MTKLISYTVVELRSMAKKKGLTGYSKLRKAELIALLQKGKKPQGGDKKPQGGDKKPQGGDKKPCTSDKIRNPETLRCVKKTGKIGLAVIAAGGGGAPPSFTPTPTPINIPQGGDKKPCTSDKIRNPETLRCVKKTGKIGLAVIAAGGGGAPPSFTPTPINIPPGQVSGKKCPKNKILNPKTNKCVLLTGKIGKAIVGGGGVDRNIYKWEKFKVKNWFLFTREGCDYCSKAGSLLSINGLKYSSWEITKKNEDAIYKQTDPYTKGYRKFPMIFNNGKFIGGFTELEQWIKNMPPLSNIHIFKPIMVSETNFKGTPWHEMVAMLYLLYKYPNDCVAIPTGFLKHGNKITSKAQQVKHFKDTSLDWNEKIQSFIVPSGLWTAVKKCLKSGANFIVMPIGFTCIGGSGHANFLIYDSKRKEMERFEPNGVMSNPCYNPPKYEDKIKAIFNKNVQADMIEEMYAPLDFCPVINFQKVQNWEDEKKPTDPPGFCAAWAAWYADTRLANPNKSRDQVIELSMEKLKDDPISFTKFIRSYAAFLEAAGKKLKKAKDPSKVFAKLVQKYT